MRLEGLKNYIHTYKKPILVITSGCVAQAENEEMFKREPTLDIVIGPQSYHKINNLLKNRLEIKIEETEIDTIDKFKH